MTVACIDSDVLVYRVGFTTEDDPEWVAKARVDESIRLILETLKTNDYKCVLTGSGRTNFRFRLYEGYKATRIKDKPKHYQFIREYLEQAHGAYIETSGEADDRLGIWITEDPENRVLCSIDKDLDQIPGKHFNWVKGEFYEITAAEGLRRFYLQLLQGDRSDCIPGLDGIGPKKAEKILDDCGTGIEMCERVCLEYADRFPDDWQRIVLRNGRLLKIRTREEEIWEFPASVPNIEAA